jgi:hypothetical protein
MQRIMPEIEVYTSQKRESKRIIYLRSRSDFYVKMRETKEKSSKQEHVL